MALDDLSTLDQVLFHCTIAPGQNLIECRQILMSLPGTYIDISGVVIVMPSMVSTFTKIIQMVYL